jgi:hypothetical protein
LRVEVETVDDGLGETREHFTEVTKKQVIGSRRSAARCWSV